MHLVRQPWWPLYALPIAALIVLAAMLVYALVTRKSALVLAVRRVLADDTAMMAVGGVAIAALNFTLAVLVDHVRLNNYDSRYLTLTQLFLPISGMLTLYLLIRGGRAHGEPPGVRAAGVRARRASCCCVGDLPRDAVFDAVSVCTR